MTVFTFDHVHLRSRDPEAAARFYVGTFGAKVAGRSGHGGSLRVVLDLHGVTLFVEQARPGAEAAAEHPALGLDHIALSVSGFEAAIADLKAQDVSFVVEPHSPRPGVKIAFVAGPDGVRIEVLERSVG